MNEILHKKRELKRRLRSNIITKEWLERTIISLGLYGKISGVIGPYIIANVNGRMVIRLRPMNFRKSYSEAAIAGRRSMAAANKFAMFIKSIDPLYELWKRAMPGNNAFTGIIKYNKKYLVNDCPSEHSSITPEGYTIGIKNIITIEKSHKIRVNETYRPEINEKLLIVCTVQDPVGNRSEKFECFRLFYGSPVPGQVIKLTRLQKVLCSNYKKFLLHAAVIREEGHKFSWSNSVVLQSQLKINLYEEAEHLGYGAADDGNQGAYAGGLKRSVQRIIHSPP